ncbi:Tat proofreading chaperone FdhE [Paraburkholderia fungorum]|nr:Tat proofreading chaperone FdhE [Paraburkholderia fungorum]
MQDPTGIPRIALPARDTLFATRAARLRKLAEHNPISGYLCLMAVLADAQQLALEHVSARMPERSAIERAQQDSMPILPALNTLSGSEPAWRDVLYGLLDRVETAGAVAPALAKVLDALRALSAIKLDAQADALLAQRFAEVDQSKAPFVMAALQVVWTDLASRINLRDVPYVSTRDSCPVCGAASVASVVRIGGAYQDHRYVQCGLCGTETHVVRVKCTNCDATKGIAYHGIEGFDGALKAESCDECHTYRKIGYLDRDSGFEPLADDLASLTLDLLMSDAGYRRASPNPLLWLEVQGDQ